MIQKSPSSNPRIANSKKISILEKYPNPILLFDVRDYDGTILTIEPRADRYGNDTIVVFVNGEIYDNITLGTDIDLTNSGIGGLVDGIAQENSRDYLIWFLANSANTEELGFAFTRKPFSSFSAISGGSAVKGTSKSFTVVNAYQFTIDSRVCVRNSVGTSPLYEWNWATVSSITNNTTLVLDMDNDSDYGTDITGVTSGEILQWNKFRPWVVTSTSQTLYSNNYRLCGEVYTDSSGNIESAFRVDDRFRRIVGSVVNENTTATSAANQSLGRYIPIWASVAALELKINSGTTNNSLRVYARIGGVDVGAAFTQTASITNSIYVADLPLDNNAIFTWESFGTSSVKNIQIHTFQVNGGMRI